MIEFVKQNPNRLTECSDIFVNKKKVGDWVSYADCRITIYNLAIMRATTKVVAFRVVEEMIRYCKDQAEDYIS